MKKVESQNVEYKRSWHDECLRWVCGFAKLTTVRYVGQDYSGHWEVD